MYRWSCLSVCVIIMLCLGFCSTLEYDFGENVFHIAVDNTMGDVYVGGDNTVYHLDENFTIIGNTTLQTTCLSCQNQVRVLEIDDTFRRLLVCGSADHGRCQFLNLANVTEKDDLDLTTSHLDESEIEGADARSPTMEYVFYPSFKSLNTSRIVVASSNYESQYNKSINSDDLSSKPVLSVREIWKHTGSFKMRYVSTNFSSPQFNHMLLKKHNLSYVFDFLDGFCHEEQCFFLTLQQVNAKSPELITRIGSVCTKSMFPYVEIPMSECRPADSKLNEPVFDRALAMSLGQVQTEGSKVELVVILIFGKSKDPTSREVDTQHGFAVCKFPLVSLQDIFKQAMTFCMLPDIAGIPDWFNASGGACVSGNQTAPDMTAKVDRCETSGSLVIQRKKGDYTDMGYHAVVPGNQTDGKVVSVFTHTQPLVSGALDERMAIFVTTSSGRVHTIYSQWTTSTEVKMTPLRDEPTQASSLDGQKHSLRKDVAVTSQYYYSLMGTKVVRRPLDYCLEVEKCHLCLNRSGCGWCPETNTCQLKAKCPGEFCLPEIDWFLPKLGPMEGGTTLTVKGTRFSHKNATIQVCQQECVPVPPFDESAGVIHCTVPPANADNATEKSCEVNVTIRRANNSSLATEPFQYKTPSIRTLQPRRMLREESGHLNIFGDHLDIGTHVNVTVGKDNCTFMNRNSDHIRCHLNSPAMSEKCFSVDVKIDNARLRLPDDQTLCRCNGPVITGIQPDWTFTGGGVPVTVTGTNLDLVKTIHLSITTKRAGNITNKTDDRQCTLRPCANGTCVICCTPNVTNFVTSPSKENVTGDVHFSMSSREDQYVNYTFADNASTIQLLPDPRFWFDGHAGAACLRIPKSSDKLKIMGKNIPAQKWIHVSIGHEDCTVLTSTETSLTCDLQRVRSLANESHPRGAHRISQDLGNVSTDPETLRTHCRTHQDQYEEQTILTEGVYRLVINIRGRRFFSAACVDFSDGSMQPGTLDGSKTITLYGVVGGSGGAALLVVVIVVCLLYIRHRKKEFQKRRYQAQHSSGSGGTLLPSPIGSAENTYVSLVHLLNPQHDKKRKREIHEKKLLIQRKYLTLGNVIGHGNFGCVYEGYLQRRSGVDEQDDMPQKVAVKTLLDPATHAIDLQSFINEALLMKDFEHDHVLGLLGLSEGDRGLPLVILPFMCRGDLLTYVKDEKTGLTVGDVLQVCTDIASGMDYLANQKLVHRDLAARNCMLDDDLRVKVADFGLCRDVYEKGYYHSDNKKKLPIRWMSIESIEKGTYSSKSDVWSLGVVMWELTTRGITPYPGVEGWDILRYLLAGRRLDQPLMCPDPLYALMERCWHEKPIERPPFCEIKQTLQTLTMSLQTPAATNALCLDTQITIPRCHRFRDDAAVIQKVLMGMHKMSGQGLAASPRAKTSRLSAPLLGGKKSPATTSRKEIKEAESVMTPAKSATTKKVDGDGLKREPVHLELMEMKEKKQEKDDYFVLET